MIDDFILYLVLWLFVYVYYCKIYFGRLLLYDYHMFFCSVNHRKQHLLSRLCPWPGEYVRQERRAGGTGTSRSGREATEAPAMPLATLTNTGIGPTLGPTNKEWASKLGKLGKCSEINIKLRIIN
jgi:hypothetical protein